MKSLKELDEKYFNAKLYVDLKAIKKNINTIEKRLDNTTKVMPIIKANAYGLGYVKVATYLQDQGIEIVGVANCLEAVLLRRNNFTNEIFVIHANFYESEYIIDENLQVAVNNMKFIQALEKEAQKKKKVVKVHLHIDTGMGRFGCSLDDVISLSKYINESKYLEFEGIFSHFPVADTPSEDAFTLNQYKMFEKKIDELEKINIFPKYKHIANSSGALRFKFTKCNMARVGIALYGIAPFEDDAIQSILAPVMRLETRVVSVNTYNKGHTIGYGRTYTVSKDKETIAVIALGYFDGLRRRFNNNYVSIRGKKARIVGNICMDYTMCNVTDIESVERGDKVLVFGDGTSIFDFATIGKDIAWQLITCLGPRIKRIYSF